MVKFQLGVSGCEIKNMLAQVIAQREKGMRTLSHCGGTGGVVGVLISLQCHCFYSTMPLSVANVCVCVFLVELKMTWLDLRIVSDSAICCAFVCGKLCGPVSR
jgi:hypothetical protein